MVSEVSKYEAMALRTLRSIRCANCGGNVSIDTSKSEMPSGEALEFLTRVKCKICGHTKHIEHMESISE
jgi:DNA-directed RNA polymerase subunit RPC12/RpoP